MGFRNFGKGDWIRDLKEEDERIGFWELEGGFSPNIGFPPCVLQREREREITAIDGMKNYTAAF